MEKTKTSHVTATGKAVFNPTIKANFVQLHPHHPTQQNIVQRFPHTNMKMPDDDASMATSGCDGKEIPRYILLSPAGLTPNGIPMRFGGCCTIIGLDDPNQAPQLSTSTRPSADAHGLRHDDVPTDMLCLPA